MEEVTPLPNKFYPPEREGFKPELVFDELVRAEKRPQLVKEVYQRADMPKPRNLVGLTRDQPVPEMENLLLASIPVSDEAVRELAVQRSVAVRDYLASRDLPSARLFLGVVKSVPPEAKWTPRAELNLAMP
ncbi:MAG: hypothetical protein ABIX00_09900 [Polaromonas sp.]